MQAGYVSSERFNERRECNVNIMYIVKRCVWHTFFFSFPVDFRILSFDSHFCSGYAWARNESYHSHFLVSMSRLISRARSIILAKYTQQSRIYSGISPKSFASQGESKVREKIYLINRKSKTWAWEASHMSSFDLHKLFLCFESYFLLLLRD